MAKVLDQSPIIQAIKDLDKVPPIQDNEEDSCEDLQFGPNEADKEWDDTVADTKEKVRVSVSKDSPNVRRVFDKKGKYMGSFDTKKQVDKTKYKSMFKAGK